MRAIPREIRPLTAAGPRFFAVLLVLVLAGPAAALKPQELLLICNADLPPSRELAQYYAKARNVPPSQICALRLGAKVGEELSAADYESRIRRPIREFMNEQKLVGPIRCLVTFYGVPIRVAGVPDTPERKRLFADLQQQFIASIDEMDKASTRIDSLGNSKPPPPAIRKPAAGEYGSILRRYGEVRQAAHQRLSKNANTPAGTNAFKEFVDLVQQIEGIAGLLGQLNVAGGQADDEPHKQLALMRSNVQMADREIEQILARGVTDPSRPAARKLMRQYHGILGLATLLDSDIQYLRSEESTAAVDSELTLLWYEDYPRYRWIPNLLSWANRENQALRHQLPSAFWNNRVLMVARLDASKPEVVHRMIDDGLATEAKGLRGKVYLDARGLYKDEGLAKYDASLRDLELLIKRNTPLSVTLDNKPGVFGRRECPDTMLYCGWYSLRQYVDSFTFAKGAVAFHIASFEAISLKTPSEQGWCKKLLDAGAAATLGPVSEPYLHAFPPPKEFFGLLLTGRFTLAECFAYTANLNSWMMMLLGDPLYRPFAAHSYLTVEQVFGREHVPPEFRTGATVSPGSQPSLGSASVPSPAASRPAGQ